MDLLLPSIFTRLAEKGSQVAQGEVAEGGAAPERFPDVVPILPLRGVVVFPQTAVPLTIAVEDTTPPVFGSGAGRQFTASLWPPNHGYVVFAVADVAAASDACGTTTLRATGCASSQPEDVHQGAAEDEANGDGHFSEDCVVSTDGTQFAVRAERLGSCGADSARVYGIQLTASDECGNAAQAWGDIAVEHDRSGGQPVLRGRKLGPNDPPPFPYVHSTTYGSGCGP